MPLAISGFAAKTVFHTAKILPATQAIFGCSKPAKLMNVIFADFVAHIVGKYDGKVFEDREVSFLMREGNTSLVIHSILLEMLKLLTH